MLQAINAEICIGIIIILIFVGWIIYCTAGECRRIRTDDIKLGEMW